MAVPNSFSEYQRHCLKSTDLDVVILNGIATRILKTVVHRFRLSDVEDPEIMAAEPLYDWQHSEQGQWVMNHAVEQPVFYHLHDYITCSTEFAVTAKFKEKDYTFWVLKWG